MKNKRIKLIASMSSLFLVFAIMVVGVWSAVSQTINVSTTISFNATGVGGTITGTLTGVGETQYYNTTNAVGGMAKSFNPSNSLSAWTLGEGTPLEVTVTDGVPSQMVFSFTITNASEENAIVVSVNDLTVGTNLQIDSVVQDSGSPATGTSGDYTLENIDESGSSTIDITISVVDETASIESAIIGFVINLSKA